MKNGILAKLYAENAAHRPKLYSMRNAITNSHDIFLTGVIDAWFGISIAMMAEELSAANGAPVCLYINSPGGDVFEASGIATLIAEYPAKVTARVIGCAASSATRIALSAATVEMSESAFFMIHNASTIGYGDKRDFEKTSGLLALADQTIAADYAKKTGMKPDALLALMDEETWYTAETAKAAGFVDLIVSNSQTPAATPENGLSQAWNLSAYKNAPKVEPTAPAALATIAAEELQALRAKQSRYLDLLQIAHA